MIESLLGLARTHMNPRAETVRRTIEQAFDDFPYPGDAQLVSPGDDGGVDLREDLKGKHWKEIPRDILRYHHDDLPFLSNIGLRYYLPAYLLAALEDDWDFLHFVIFNLAPTLDMYGYESKQDYLRKRFSEFTPTQKLAIREFMEFVRDEMSDRPMRSQIASALEDYWGTVEPAPPSN